MYDRRVDDPRLSRWYKGDEELPEPVFDEIREALQTRYRVPLKGPGLNYYRDGRDSVAPHRDRELRHLDETLIAIVTLGAQRPFLVKPCRGPPQTSRRRRAISSSWAAGARSTGSTGCPRWPGPAPASRAPGDGPRGGALPNAAPPGAPRRFSDQT